MLSEVLIIFLLAGEPLSTKRSTYMVRLAVDLLTDYETRCSIRTRLS